jgi:hypothetical protein
MKGSLVSFFYTIPVTSQYQTYGNHWGYLSASMSKINNWASFQCLSVPAGPLIILEKGTLAMQYFSAWGIFPT